MQAVLVMFRPDGERRSFSVTRDMTVIGRREDCDLRIPLGDVSRKHCRLVRDGDILKIEDLGSSNGTYLNAQRVQEALLSPGDSIQVGPVVFVLQLDGEPADDELSPVSVPMEASASASDDEASDVLMPTNLDDDDDSMESLEPLPEGGGELEELEAEDENGVALEPIASGSGTGVNLDALEPLDELDPLAPDFDLTDESATGAGGQEAIDLEDKRS
jgi:predicted component of type VI protein secretion system